MYETSLILMRTLLVTSTAHETTSIRCWVVANFGTWDDELRRQFENSIQMTKCKKFKRKLQERALGCSDVSFWQRRSWWILFFCCRFLLCKIRLFSPFCELLLLEARPERKNKNLRSGMLLFNFYCNSFNKNQVAVIIFEIKQILKNFIELLLPRDARVFFSFFS